MPTIQEPRLWVQTVVGHPGRRRLVVSYDLSIQPDDVLTDQIVTERASIRGRDLHDAPADAVATTIAVVGDEVSVRAGVMHRELNTEVNRVDLDVQQDWWRTDTGGGVEPIAEFPDHLQADIQLSVGGAVVAEATTPLLTGSWGALGED